MWVTGLHKIATDRKTVPIKSHLQNSLCGHKETVNEVDGSQEHWTDYLQAGSELAGMFLKIHWGCLIAQSEYDNCSEFVEPPGICFVDRVNARLFPNVKKSLDALNSEKCLIVFAVYQLAVLSFTEIVFPNPQKESLSSWFPTRVFSLTPQTPHVTFAMIMRVRLVYAMGSKIHKLIKPAWSRWTSLQWIYVPARLSLAEGMIDDLPPRPKGPGVAQRQSEHSCFSFWKPLSRSNQRQSRHMLDMGARRGFENGNTGSVKFFGSKFALWIKMLNTTFSMFVQCHCFLCFEILWIYWAFLGNHTTNWLGSTAQKPHRLNHRRQNPFCGNSGEQDRDPGEHWSLVELPRLLLVSGVHLRNHNTGTHFSALKESFRMHWDRGYSWEKAGGENSFCGERCAHSIVMVENSK